MLPLKIYTLGRLSILRGDQSVTGFISRKVEALLVYLAFHRREHSREILAELLWEDLTQARALGNLRTALSNLQSLLADYIVATRQTVMINPDCECWMDALELATVLKSTEGNLTSASARQLEKALDRYEGEFLAGFHLREGQGFESWRFLEAETLHRQVIDALMRLAQYALHHGNFSAGIDHARRALGFDPLSEVAHRTLMQLLARSGQRGAALAQYETCVRVLREELDIAPEPETTRLYAQIQTEQITSQPAAKRATLRIPIPATPFVQRPVEIKQIDERLENPGCRLLTIVGAGGIGKTRLALQVAAAHAGAYRDGIYFVSLASVSSGEFLPLEIARSLRFSLQGAEDPRDELIRFLAPREVLLVLDNFEHLVESAALLSDILQSAPGVRVLATSRIWLNLQEEWVLPVDGMAYPPAVTPGAVNFDAVRFFAACAQRVRPRFSLQNELAHVVKICQAVEGIPLCIELAATWLRAIPASEIAHHIDVKFLSASTRNLPDRHRSVRAVFDYSWKLLSSAETAVMMKLSVFEGAFESGAATRVADATLPILASLVEKSQIRLVDDCYYDMHDLLRQYAFEHLTESRGADATRDRLLEYYVWLVRDPDSLIHGQQQTEWLDRLDREHDNLRTAIRWSMEKGTPEARQLGLALGAAIWEFWLMRGHISEGRKWLDQILAATENEISKDRGAATQGAGYLAWIQGEYDRAEALHKEGLEIRRAIDDKAGMGGSLSNLGVIAWSRGEFDQARRYYEQALAARREANYTIGVASVLTNLSLLLQDQSEYADAMTYAQEAWDTFQELNDLQGSVHVLFNMGAMTYDQGDYERARSLQEQALERVHELGDQRIMGALLQNLGQTLISLGEYQQAHTYLDESLALVSQVGDKQHIALAKKNMARLAFCEGRMEDARALLSESLELFRSLKVDVYYAQALILLGDIRRQNHEYADAGSAYREALTILVKARNQATIAEAIYCLGGLAFQRGDAFRAAVLLAYADTLAARYGLRFPNKPERIDRAVLPASLSPSEFERAETTGRAMSLADLSVFLNLDSPPR